MLSWIRNTSRFSRFCFSFYAIWLVFISGLLSHKTGGPGIVQALELRELLHVRKGQLEGLRQEVTQLEQQKQQIQSERHVQVDEVRRVLGYTGKDELVFLFR